jgi:hypothetical protein
MAERRLEWETKRESNGGTAMVLSPDGTRVYVNQRALLYWDVATG